MDQDSFDPEALRQHVRDLAGRSKELQEELAAGEIDVQSPDRSISVTVTVQGVVRDLRLQPSAVEDRSAAEIARAVLDVLKAAQAASEKVGKDLTRQYLPDLPDFKAMAAALREWR